MLQLFFIGIMLQLFTILNIFKFLSRMRTTVFNIENFISPFFSRTELEILKMLPSYVCEMNF